MRKWVDAMSLAFRSDSFSRSLARSLPLQLFSPYHSPVQTPLLYLCLSHYSFLLSLALSPSHRIRSQAWREAQRERERCRALYQQVWLMWLSAVSQGESPWRQEVSLLCIAAFCATSCSLERTFHTHDWSCAHNVWTVCQKIVLAVASLQLLSKTIALCYCY